MNHNKWELLYMELGEEEYDKYVDLLTDTMPAAAKLSGEEEYLKFLNEQLNDIM